MSIRNIIITFTILASVIPLFSEDIDKNEILKSMEFPAADLRMGNALNNPFFALNIMSKNVNAAELKKTILSIGKESGSKSDSVKLYELGNCYNELMNYETAIRYYKEYLKLNSPSYESKPEEYKTILTKGEIYFKLSEIDVKTHRKENLDKALLYYTKTIELNPDNPGLWIKLGDCYLTIEKTTEALYCYNKALEKKENDFEIYARMQASVFQRDYIKLLGNKSEENFKNQSIIQGYDFDYIQTAINNSSGNLKESFKLQHYIYLLRLLTIKSDLYHKDKQTLEPDLNKLFLKEEESILNEAGEFLNKIDNKNFKQTHLKYLSGMVNYLKSDFRKAGSDFSEILNESKDYALVHDEIILINLSLIKDDTVVQKIIKEFIKLNPSSMDYLILAGLEFKNKNYTGAEMLCSRSLKINPDYPEAYSGIAVINAINGNYIAADEMIRKGNFLIRKGFSDNTHLFYQMKVNEAAIALLKKEKERAYLLLRSVISVDNNDKALHLYNRYFTKNEKIRN
jgi:tetratricopeptide (TPR) repeat protein